MTANKILKAKQVLHTGRLFGTISNGGTITVGNLQIEFIASDSKFRTVQVYEYSIGESPETQSFVRTKKVVEKVEVAKKDKQEAFKFEHSKEMKKW